MKHLDMDRYMEEKHGSSIPEIFDKKGEKVFRELERDALRSTGEQYNTIISTGGGAPCYLNNMEWLLVHGTVIFIKCDPEIIAERIEASRWVRPIVRKFQGEALLKFVREHMQKRMPFYEQAHYIHEVQSENDLNIETLKNLIVNQVLNQATPELPDEAE